MEGSSAPQLRPLGVGEILDAAFKIYRANFKTLMLCLLVLTVPGTILQTLVTASVDPDAFNLDRALEPQPAADNELDIDTTALAGQAVGSFILALLGVASFVACFRAISTAYLGEGSDWKASLGFGLRKLPRMLWLAFLYVVVFVVFFAPVIALGVAAPIAFSLLLVWLPAWIWLSIRLSMFLPVGLFEDIGGVRAFTRSFKLVAGRWWPTFGVLLIMNILVSVLQVTIAGLLIIPLVADAGNELLAGIVTTVANILIYTLTLPLVAGAWLVAYYDLRVRKEGLDLALVAERFGATSPESVARSSGLGGYPSPQPQPQAPEQQTYGGFSAPQSPRPPERDGT